MNRKPKKPKKPPSVLLRIARKKYFPNITRRLDLMETDEGIEKLKNRIKDWYVGADSFNKSKEKINDLKLEAGQIIVDFNYWFSDRDDEGFQEL